MSIRPKIICIVGPTASGKSDLGIRLARKFHGEIVSADSRQVYRGMDIGTAKPPISLAPRKRAVAKSSVPSDDGIQPIISGGILHHLFDIKNPDQNYTVAQYQRDAVAAIKKILRSGKTPFLVGGTGLYVSAVTQNWQIPKIRPNQKLRGRLERELKRRGLAALYRKLLKLDPEAAYVVDAHNPRRVVRALEVSILSGKPFTRQRQKGKPFFDCLLLGLNLPKELLRKRIEARSAKMLKSGLAAEVKRLLSKYGDRPTAFDAIGYREIIPYLRKQVSLQEAVKLINRNTRRFAKRQLTWFRKMPVVWVKNGREAEAKIRKFLS